MTRVYFIFLISLLGSLALRAQVPQIISYQGRVVVGTTSFDGTGTFRFALVNSTGTTTFWSNDGTSTGGSQPTAGVTLPVTKGLYAVKLGDTSLGNMQAIPASVFGNADVRLRVWFNDGAHGSQLLTPDQRIAAVGYAMMAGNVTDGSITTAKIASGAVGSAQLATGAVGATQLASGAVGSSQLASGAAAANLGAGGQSAVGSGGLVMSAGESSALVGAGFVKIGTTSLADGWQLRGNGSPSARSGHTAVWTPAGMIVWGGYHTSSGYLGDGARYNPTTNTWTALNASGAPTQRTNHTAIWTGTEMIIWGGYNGSTYLNDGARYNPTTDTWTSITTTNVPAPRCNHTAVWDNTGMIVWGGFNGTYLNTGARFNPTTNTWTTLSVTNAPSARIYQTAVWSNSEMLVWGGLSGGTGLADGARYNPTTDTWVAINPAAAPSGRYFHTAVWSGAYMVVWGGYSGSADLADGARYNPTTNLWSTLSTLNAPSARDSHTAVWTNTEMIVWGGYGSSAATNSGARYNPATDAWNTTALNLTGMPTARYGHTAVWSGTEMIVWGGGNGTSYFPDGARFNNSGNSWTAAAPACPLSGRSNHTAIWSGTEMIVWGGFNGTASLGDGARYNPSNNSWIALPALNSPGIRYYHTAVWTGTEMIVWGGYNTTAYLNNGGRFNPTSGVWNPTAISATNAPSIRSDHSAVWTGTEMIIFGGYNGTTTHLGDGARFTPTTNTWVTLPSNTQPAMPRSDHTAIWTGSAMLVWGGYNGTTNLSDGVLYAPPTATTADSWTATITVAAPVARCFHTAVWSGTEMIVWGGYSGAYLGLGGRYAPLTGIWTATSNTGAPPNRSGHTAVWTGREMLVFGGANGGYLNDTYSYSAGKTMFLYQKP